jgi:hypothetical protein
MKKFLDDYNNENYKKSRRVLEYLSIAIQYQEKKDSDIPAKML